MSQYKLNIGLNHPYGGLKNRSNAYQVRAKQNKSDEFAKRRGLTHENINDVPAPSGRMQPELIYQQNQENLQQELQRQEKERKNMQMFEDKEKEEKEIRQSQIQKAINEEARIDEIDTLVEKNINAQSKIRQQKTIKDVIEISTRHADANVDLDWLLIDETKSKYYNVGKFIRKHDFTPSGFEGLGLYLPREDYASFYNYSNIEIFYEFEKAVFSDVDLNGKIFKTDERFNKPNFDATEIDTRTRTMDLNNKKEYVRTAKQFMRNAIKIHLGISPNIRDDDPNWEFKKYINVYEQIVPMVQRSLEQNPNYNGNITMAIAQLDSLEEKVKKSIPNFTDEKYITGEYIETIRKLLSPVSAEIRPPASATVIPTAAASAASAAPESVFSSLGNYVPSFLGNAASGTASYLGNYGKKALSSGINFGIANTGLPIQQHHEGTLFQRHAPPATPEYRTSNNLVAAEPFYTSLLGRDYPASQETWRKAKQEVARREDANAAANKMPLFSFGGPRFGGKRKSKRKQRRSRKQKKSRKQRR